jgi:hypothetical protein
MSNAFSSGPARESVRHPLGIDDPTPDATREASDEELCRVYNDDPEQRIDAVLKLESDR